MKLLRKIFFLEKIYFKNTVRDIANTQGLFLLLAVFGLLFTYQYVGILWLYIAIGLLWAYFLTRTLLRTYIVNRRIGKVKYVPISPLSQEAFVSSASHELDGIDYAHMISKNKATKLYDAVFNIYNDDGNLSKQNFYTIFEVELNRHLPHLLFDSKASKGRQFKYMYLKVQRISLEGDFDTYFDTYAPQTYHIDSLSFITPEVMEAMVDTQQYDLEIIGNKLMVYAPLIDFGDIEELVSKGVNLANHINDNIDNYRDTRLDYEKGKVAVTPFGRALLKSPIKHLAWLFVCAIAICMLAIAAITYPNRAADILFNYFAFVVYAVFAGNAWQLFKIKRENKKRSAEFEKQLKYNKA